MTNDNDFIILKGILLRYKSTYPFAEIPDGVTCIGKEAFAYSDIRTVKMPKTVTKIDDSAFVHCEKLHQIELSENLTSIGSNAFSYCSCLSEIKLPDTLLHLGYSAFEYCWNLERINLPDSILELGSSCFKYTDLEEISIPKDIKIINSSTFKSCDKLKRVVLPEGLEIIRDYAFSGCKSLESINFPDSLKEVDDEAFDGCVCLTNENGFIIVKDILTSYSGDSRIVRIPDGVKTIGNSAFYKNYRIRNVILPDSVKSIGRYAFAECPCLRVIDRPPGPLYIDESAFDRSERLGSNDIFDISNHILHKYKGKARKVVIPDGVEIIGADAFSCVYNNEVEEISIPESVHTIEENAFKYCTNLKKVNMPEKMKSIKYNAFHYCEKLETIIVPEGIEELEGGVFEYCKNLKNIILPQSLKIINYRSISNCWSLEGLSIPCGVEKIRGELLEENYLVTEINIPDSVKVIEDCDFRDIQLNIYKMNRVFRIVPKHRMDSNDERLLWEMLNEPSIETFNSIKTGAYKVALAEKLYPEYKEYGPYLKKNIGKAIKDAVLFNDDELLNSLKNMNLIDCNKFEEYLNKAEEEKRKKHDEIYSSAEDIIKNHPYINIYYLKKIAKDLDKIKDFVNTEDLIKSCNERIDSKETEKKEEIYKRAVDNLNNFYGTNPYYIQTQIRNELIKIRDYKDSEELICKCDRLIDQVNNINSERQYQEALALFNEYDGSNREKLEEAIDKFERLPGFRDSEDILRKYYLRFYNIDIQEGVKKNDQVFQPIREYRQNKSCRIKKSSRSKRSRQSNMAKRKKIQSAARRTRVSRYNIFFKRRRKSGWGL